VRIRTMRQALVDGLQAAGVRENLDHITRQKGMFSYSGLSREQMLRLREEFAVYGLDSGRICVAALNQGNLPRVIQALVAVMDATVH
jgi:aromatic-amino-acid transaminase